MLLPIARFAYKRGRAGSDGWLRAAIALRVIVIVSKRMKRRERLIFRQRLRPGAGYAIRLLASPRVKP